MREQDFPSFKSSFEGYILVISTPGVYLTSTQKRIATAISTIYWYDFNEILVVLEEKQKSYPTPFLTFISHLTVMLYLKLLIFTPKSPSV